MPCPQMMVIANGGSRAAIAGQLLGLVAAHLGTQHLLTSSEANALQVRSTMMLMGSGAAETGKQA